MWLKTHRHIVHTVEIKKAFPKESLFVVGDETRIYLAGVSQTGSRPSAAIASGKLQIN